MPMRKRENWSGISKVLERNGGQGWGVWKRKLSMRLTRSDSLSPSREGARGKVIIAKLCTPQSRMSGMLRSKRLLMNFGRHWFWMGFCLQDTMIIICFWGDVLCPLSHSPLSKSNIQPMHDRLSCQRDGLHVISFSSSLCFYWNVGKCLTQPKNGLLTENFIMFVHVFVLSSTRLSLQAIMWWKLKFRHCLLGFVFWRWMSG